MSGIPQTQSLQTASPQTGVLEFSGVSKWYGQVSALMDVGFRLTGGVTGQRWSNGAALPLYSVTSAAAVGNE